MSLDDRFELGAPIHIGQISAAYPAIQKSDQKKVLLKVIHPQWINDQELLRRFDREARALAELDHPNVVKVFAYSTTDDLPYMSIEWMDGGTLEDRIKAGPLNQQELKRIAQEILSGLRAVHQQGLIHRDLKPDNILLSSSGTVKLADFSLAGFDKRSGLTQHGAIVGSPAYMAPELIEGHPASFQSDLYSLG